MLKLRYQLIIIVLSVISIVSTLSAINCAHTITELQNRCALESRYEPIAHIAE